jgi:hypothetical protein
VSCQEDAEDIALSEAKSINLEWMEQRVQALSSDDMQGRDNLTLGSERAREYLVGEMEALGLQPAGTDGWMQAFPEGVNLIGLMSGGDPELSGEYVVVGAHYDHIGMAGVTDSKCIELDGDTICNGAADNASGCAATLAIAKALIESAVARRSVLILFLDAEEDGKFGSLHFTSEPTVPLDSLVAFCNVDNIGGEIIPEEESSFVLGVEYTQGIRELVWDVNKRLRYNNFPVSAFFDGSEDGERNDAYTFRTRGIPSFLHSSGAAPEYHTPADAIGIINRDKFLNITRHAYIMTRELAVADSRPGSVADYQPHLDDAVALVSLGETVMEDPAAIGLTDEGTITIFQGWIEDLQEYIDNPPQTQEEWDDYEKLVRMIIAGVYMFLES